MGQITHPICPETVAEYIHFSDSNSQCRAQEEGVAAAWNIMHKNGRFAYLADEVGMGKTYQALGVIASVFRKNNNARVVIMCPGYQLQNQWIADYHNFIRECYLQKQYSGGIQGDDVIKDIWHGEAVLKPELYNNIRHFAADLLLDKCRIAVLRYSSFSLPLRFQYSAENSTVDKMIDEYTHALHQIGTTPSPTIEKWREEYRNKWDDDNKKELGKKLNKEYAKWIKRLINDHREIDLLVFDEAQYLRHTHNMRNTHIKTIFLDNVDKYLFMSATPLHSTNDDIRSLDTYIPGSPLDGNHKIAELLDAKVDLRDVLKQFLIRRTRSYVRKKSSEHFGKTTYRHNSEMPVSMTEKPMHSLLMALVQKSMVKLLDGNNNKFRIGECSSFESLQESIKKVKELEKSSDKDKTKTGNEEDEKNTTIDKKFIENLSLSFKEKFGKNRELPHPKMESVVSDLVEKCLKEGSSKKALVFVRRLATVDELITRLQQEHQRLINERIDAWHELHPDVPTHKEYWNLRDDEHPEDDDTSEEEDDSAGAMNKTERLDFFWSLERRKGGGNGMLVGFQAALLRKEEGKGNPLLFLQDADIDRELWERLLGVLIPDCEKLNEIVKSFKHKKRGGDHKEAVLKRCILHTLRRTDFLVDLNILHKFYSRENQTLGEKLIKCLNGEMVKSNPLLASYFENMRKKLADWMLHIDLIARKCFKDENHSKWADIHQDIDQYFLGLSAVVGRSGNIENKYAVAQFKFPVYPNILVCTDVLKEGINLHLFCDEVYHYGVAWTSGDLEQRIGRVDRFESFIERKIYNSPQDTIIPKLNVGFPYLDGTLDKRQTKYVIRRKTASDAILDLGMSKKEANEFSIQDKNNSSEQKKFNSIGNTYLPENHIPEATNAQLITQKDRIRLKKKNDNLRSVVVEIKSAIKNFSNGTRYIEKASESGLQWESTQNGKVLRLTYVAQLNCFTLEVKKAIMDSNPDKWAFKLTFERTIKRNRRAYFQGHILILPLECCDNKGIKIIIDTFLNEDPMLFSFTAINPKDDQKNAFKFSGAHQCQVFRCDIEDPFGLAENKERHQNVLLEQSNGIPCLRSFICNSKAQNDKNLYSYAIEQNGNVSIGHFNVSENEDLWFCVPLHAITAFSIDDLKRLLRYTALTADRHQHLLTGTDEGDDVKTMYTSNMSLDSQLSPMLGSNGFREIESALEYSTALLLSNENNERENIKIDISREDYHRIDEAYNSLMEMGD